MIRTDFTSDETWREVVQAATEESEHGFCAELTLVDDITFERADPQILAELAEGTTQHVLLVVADARTMADPERTLLCIDPLPPGGSFKNNVSLANMDFAEFASATDADGVFRGFNA